MSKINLVSTAGGFNLSAINQNLQNIMAALNNGVLWRNNPPGEPNQMVNTNLDMNGNRIINLGRPVNNNDAARLQDVQDAIAGDKSALLTTFEPYKWVTGMNVQAAIQGMVDELELEGAKYIGFKSTKFPTAVKNTQQQKDEDTISVTDFGAAEGGVFDNTVAFQLAMDSGSRKIYIPAGSWLCGEVFLPTSQVDVFGDGVATLIIQNGKGWKYRPLSVNCYDTHSTIRDLAFKGTNGTENTLDTTFAQTIDLRNLFFWDIPPNLSALKLDGNPISGTYMHDVRVNGLRIYSQTPGNAGLALGSYASDSEIRNFIMQGFFEANYCVVAEDGASTISFADSHIYNAKINIVNQQNNNSYFSYTSCVLDNSLGDNMRCFHSTYTRFSNVWFETINAGQHGLVLEESWQNTGSLVSFQCPIGTAAAAIAEGGTSDNNKFFHGSTEGNFTQTFIWSGFASFDSGYTNTTPFGVNFPVAMNGQEQLQPNTARDLGINGFGTVGQVGFCIPSICRLLYYVVYIDTVSAQTLTFNIRNGATIVATVTIPAGAFGNRLIPTGGIRFNEGDQISVQCISPAGGSAVYVRSTMLFSA